MNNSSKVNNSNGGKILFISDLEGCAPFGPNGKTPQSNKVCSPEFFNELDKFMDSNLNNKLAFLGDYFDKGMQHEETINRIIKLYEKYNPKKSNSSGKNNINIDSTKKRVYIILGNRDLNKLRLLFEYKLVNIVTANKFNSKLVSNKNKSSFELLWGVWKNFYTSYFDSLNSNKSEMERFKIIFKDSMGAAQSDDNYYIILKDYFDKVLFGNQNNNFNKLFKYGKIVDYDQDFKVLLSHAGGIGYFLFHNLSYYENIKSQFTKIDPKNINMVFYFQNIEKARRALMNPPSGEDIYILSNLTNNNTKLAKLKEIISIINAPLVSFMSNMTITNPDFYLLQALGLKPDKIESDYFASFVQSCDCVFCKGPRNINFYPNNLRLNKKTKYDKFLEDLKNLNIKFVSFGHNPHCTPVPIIYQHSDDENKIIFIGNDVSNGFRPANINSIYKIPLAYVSKDKAGVGFLNNAPNNLYAPTNISSNLISTMTLPPSLEQFKGMIDQWDYENIPKFDSTTKTIKYEKTLQLNSSNSEASPKKNTKTLTFNGRLQGPFTKASMK